MRRSCTSSSGVAVAGLLAAMLKLLLAGLKVWIPEFTVPLPVQNAMSPGSVRTHPALRLQLPAATQRLVEIHDDQQLIPLHLGQRVLRREQLLFGVEDLEIARATAFVALVCQVHR